MTSAQRKLYSAALRIARSFGTGGATWRRTRATGAAPGTAPTLTQASGVSLTFIINSLLTERASLPHMPIYDAAYWGIGAAGVDVQVGDIFDNSLIAFVVKGAPDVSQGFMLIPADQVGMPRSLALGGGFRAGLRIGAF